METVCKKTVTRPTPTKAAPKVKYRMDETAHETTKVLQFLRRHFVRIVIGAVLAVAIYGMLTVWMPYQREQRIARTIDESDDGLTNWRYFGPNWIPLSVRHRLPFLDRIASIQLLGTSTSALSELGSLTSLQEVILTGPQFTDASLEHLKGLTNLEVLRIWDTQVTDSGLQQLKGLANLKVLHLNTTLVTDAGLEHLKGLTKLSELGLSMTKVTGPGFEHLKGLTNLKTLVLKFTQMTDAGLEHLKGLTNLEELYLTNTHVTAKGRASLSTALPNCEIVQERDTADEL